MQVLHQVVEIVNYIKRRPLKSRLFEEICKSMDSQYVRLLTHTDVRWLSKGKVLTRVHELKKELMVFFDKEKHERLCKYLRCEFWMVKMEYLTEIFGAYGHTTLTTSPSRTMARDITLSSTLLTSTTLSWSSSFASTPTPPFPS